MEYAEIVKIVTDVCAAQGFGVDMPIKMNPRLSRTLGRVKYRTSSLGIRVEVMEFSTKFFKDPAKTEDVLRQIILHETAHYLAFKYDGQVHEHDKIFRYWCTRIGCKATGEYITDENNQVIENIKIQYKYDCRCSKCGNHLRYYKRFPNTLDRRVSGCCHAKLDLIQLY